MEDNDEMNDYAYRRAQAERQMNDEAKAAIRALSDYVNRYHDMKPLVEAMSHEHRTLQQCMTGFMLKWFLHLSELGENWYDLRNEASVKVARKIVSQIEEVKWGLPLI